MNIGTGFLKVAAPAVLLLGGLTLGAAASNTGLVQVSHNVAPAVAKAQFLGHHDPSAQLDISIALKLRNTTGLSTFLSQLRDPSSPNYRKFLTPRQFRDAYGPTQTEVDAVKQFLTSRGITVGAVSRNRTRIHASASTAVLESAFGVAVNDYAYQGAKFYSASTDPSLPADIGSNVVAVMGLDDAVQLQPHSIQAPAKPQPRGTGLATPAGFSPQQIATAYQWPSLTDTTQASGVTIAIATAFTYRADDIAKFWKQYGLPSHTLTNVSIDGNTRRLDGETTLDIERSSAMSPGSSIRVYEAVNPAFTTFDDEFVQIADDDLADVVSTSWGASEKDTPFASIQAEHASFIQLAIQGMPIMAAAGDDGSADRTSGTDNADFPASDPLVIAAGGTTLALNPDDSIASETAWSGAGGADSLFFAVPIWQSGFTNGACDGDHTGDFATGGCTGGGADSRQSSDMAMDADPATGYAIYYNGRWEVFGGTSFVAPELAGFFAIVTARLRVNDSNTTVRTGDPHFAVYIDASTTNPNDFNDITVGSNGMFDAGTGWDHPTGWGSPNNADILATHLAAVLGP